MPWVFLCLMLANTAYFGWRFVGEQPNSSGQISEVGAKDIGKNVLLLSERQASMADVQAAGKVERPEELEASASTIPAAHCYNVGPFKTEVTANKLGALMKERGFASRIEARKVEERDFWVFVPPFTNRQRAEEKLGELQKRGIEGFVVRDGVFVNSISLNHFSKKDLADSFLQQMQSAGVVVESREIKRSGMEFWVRLSESLSDRDLRASVDEYLKEDESLRREKAACEE